MDREVIELFQAEPELVTAAAQQLVEDHFPDSIQSEVLSAVGLEPLISRDRRRDPAFREMVLTAYGYRCAACGFDLAIGRAPVGVEAAHVKWVQAQGPDTIENGMALCALHHKLFDLGAWGIDEEYRLRVSEEVRGRSLDDLLDLNGKPLLAPAQLEEAPDAAYVNWHCREVFRGRARSL